MCVHKSNNVTSYIQNGRGRHSRDRRGKNWTDSSGCYTKRYCSATAIDVAKARQPKERYLTAVL